MLHKTLVDSIGERKSIPIFLLVSFFCSAMDQKNSTNTRPLVSRILATLRGTNEWNLYTTLSTVVLFAMATYYTWNSTIAVERQSMLTMGLVFCCYAAVMFCKKTRDEFEQKDHGGEQRDTDAFGVTVRIGMLASFSGLLGGLYLMPAFAEKQMIFVLIVCTLDKVVNVCNNIRNRDFADRMERKFT